MLCKSSKKSWKLNHAVKTIIAFAFLCCTCFNACRAGDTIDRSRGLVTVRPFRLGKTVVSAQQVSFQADTPFLFVHLHSDEATAHEAIQAVMYQWEIPLVQLLNKSSRLVRFRLQGQAFRFDPNRIFSDKGIRQTLRLSGQYTDGAFRIVQRFRDSLLSLLPTSHAIVAVHNNTEGRLTILQYRDAGSGQVHLNAGQDPDDFFITNSEGLFARLKEKNVNVVLEDTGKMDDDGSLSLYCSRHHIPYINVEAQHGHRAEQLQMLETVCQILKQDKK